jgi:hypothetical protein
MSGSASGPRGKRRSKFRASTPEQIEAEFDAYLEATGERTSRMVRFSSFVHQARKLEDVIVY